jgi:predicted DNA-binding transcriptional regulator AlpA
MNAEPYLTRAELVRHFKLGRTTICALEKAGLPKHRWGKRIIRYRVSEVDAWLRENAGP